MNLTNLLAVVQATAKSIAASVGPALPVAIAAGRAVLDLVNDIKPTLAEPDQAKLAAELPALLEAMNREVDAAVNDLRGG